MRSNVLSESYLSERNVEKYIFNFLRFYMMKDLCLKLAFNRPHFLYLGSNYVNKSLTCLK